MVVDSPPVLAASDARSLSQQVDATVVVVRWASTNNESVKLSLKQLESAGAKLAGSLLTMVDARRHAKYGYGDSGSYAGDLEKYYAG